MGIFINTLPIHNLMPFHAIKFNYNYKLPSIKMRLQDFSSFRTNQVSWFYNNNKMELRQVFSPVNQRIFEELVFCLLTANTSAVMGIKGVDAVRDVMMTATLEELQDRLKGAGYRYPNKRPEYIIEARAKNIDFESVLETFDDPKELREYFASEVKGLGYKEASHFLRNIGVFGLAILDKHILRTLHEYGMIDSVPKSLNKRNYLEIEQKFIEFSNQLNINMDELDILLWSMKNGNIMK